MSNSVRVHIHCISPLHKTKTLEQNGHSFECIHLPCSKFWNNPPILYSLVIPLLKISLFSDYIYSWKNTALEFVCQLMQCILCGLYIRCRLCIMWWDSHVSKFHLCFRLRVTGCITHCSVMTEQFIAGEKDVQTRHQSHRKRTALNKVLLNQINHPKFTSQLLKLYLF